MNFYVGAVWFEQTMFTLRDRIYSPALHHRRSCTPNYILFVGVTGFEPIEFHSAGFTGQCSSTIWAALPIIFQWTSFCGPNEIRTRNGLSPTPLIKSQLRFQLRHGTLPVVPKGLEPLTPALKERCAHPVAPRDLSIMSVLYVFVLSVSFLSKFLCYKYMNYFSNPKIFFNFLCLYRREDSNPQP